MSYTETDLIPIAFSDVPEITSDMLEGEFLEIKTRRRKAMDSYGASVLRSAGPEVIDECVRLLGTVTPPGHKVGSEILRSLGEDDTILKDMAFHKDTNRRTKNRMSVHVGLKNECESIILVGGRLLMQVASEAATRLLFDRSLLDSNEFAVPKLALRTKLSENDTLIFDHSQPHAFRTLVYPRHSEAFYISYESKRLAKVRRKLSVYMPEG